MPVRVHDLNKHVLPRLSVATKAIRYATVGWLTLQCVKLHDGILYKSAMTVKLTTGANGMSKIDVKLDE